MILSYCVIPSIEQPPDEYGLYIFELKEIV